MCLVCAALSNVHIKWNLHNVTVGTIGALKGGGGCLAAAAKSKFKEKTRFVDKIRSMVLHDLIFSPNKLLKWADDWYMRN
jgi:hypothetical protein